MIERAIARRGVALALWGPSRSANATAGVDDPEWIKTSDITAVLVEHTAKEATMLAGGPIASAMATVYLKAEDGSALHVGDMLATASRKVWRVETEPVQPAAGGHYEASLQLQRPGPAEIVNEGALNG
jgi:hypothetical protein